MRNSYEVRWIYTDKPQESFVDVVVAKSVKEAKKRFEPSYNERIVSVRAA